MGDVLTKIADLLVTNLSGLISQVICWKNDVNLADLQLADLSNGWSAY